MPKKVILLLLISFVVRLFIGFTLELGNDEVYYWTYLKHPDWSFFDHPAMISVIGRVFSLNLLFESEGFLRLGSIVLSTISGWVFYKLVEKYYNANIAWYALLMFVGSIYCFLICGVFLMPDAPLALFWLLTLYFGLKIITEDQPKFFILFGLMIALAVFSKYQAVFLWFGMGLFILFYRRKYMLSPYLYLGFLISVIGIIPTVIWNEQHNWASFSFHSGRIGGDKPWFNPEYFFSEVFGEIFYNNPFNFVLIVWMFFKFKKEKIKDFKTSYLLLSSVPLVLTTLYLSLGNRTLPHWSAPAYFSFFILASEFLVSQKKIQWFPKASVIFIVILIVLGWEEIHYGLIMNGKSASQAIEKKGKHDFSQDTFGWRQLGGKFGDYLEEQSEPAKTIISNKWFPAAHLQFYVARVNRMNFLAIGDSIDIHQYIWNNNYEKPIEKGEKVYYITSSNNYKDPKEIYSNLFEINTIPDTISIERKGQIIRYHYIYKLIKK